MSTRTKKREGTHHDLYSSWLEWTAREGICAGRVVSGVVTLIFSCAIDHHIATLFVPSGRENSCGSLPYAEGKELVKI